MTVQNRFDFRSNLVTEYLKDYSRSRRKKFWAHAFQYPWFMAFDVYFHKVNSLDAHFFEHINRKRIGNAAVDI